MLFFVNAVLGAATLYAALDALALFHKSVRAQAWVLWDSGAVDFSRRDTRYGFAEPIPTNREEFADFVLMGGVQRQERTVNAALAWLGVSSAGLLGLTVWSRSKRKRLVSP